MHYVYVLYSLKDNRLYKGYSSDLAKRFRRHNSSGTKTTSKRKPFVLIHLESFEQKSDAIKRENYLKSLEGGSKLRDYLKELKILGSDGELNISNWLGG